MNQDEASYLTQETEESKKRRRQQQKADVKTMGTKWMKPPQKRSRV